MRVAIIAALPGELEHIVSAGFKRLATSSKTVMKWVCPMAEDEWVAVCAGMGPNAARRAFAEAETGGKLDRVLSIGWAGALNDATVSTTRAYVATTVVDAQTGERFALSIGDRALVLVSTARVADETEKHRLAETYGGAMVDMESVAIVRLAQMRGVPVCCVKAISDESGARLPDFNRFIDARGQMRLWPFVRYVATRPRYWRPLVRLGRTSSAAAHHLASAVSTILTGPKDFDEINRTGNVDW